MAGQLRTVAVEDPQDFARLGEQWRSLCRDSDADNVFLTWDWVETWWEVFGHTKELAVAAAYDDSELVGIAPLYRWRAGGPGRPGVLRLLGSGDSVSPDYLSFVTRRGYEVSATGALLEHALRPDGGTALDMSDVPEDAPLVRLLASKAGAGAWSWSRAQWAECPYAVLPDRWENYERGLTGNMRSNLRRRTRKLMRELGARVLRWHATEQIDTAVEELARLHRLRWTGRAERYGFSDAGYLAFHHRIADRFAARGWLRLYGLEVEGAVIAAWYGYRYGDVLYYYQSGFDPAWHAHSPGMVLKAIVIREAIEEGVKELDLLKGAHPYKRSWADRSRRTVRLMIARPGVRGRLLVAPGWFEERKRRLKAALPAPARVWLGRLRDTGSRPEGDAHAAR